MVIYTVHRSYYMLIFQYIEVNADLRFQMRNKLKKTLFVVFNNIACGI